MKQKHLDKVIEILEKYPKSKDCDLYLFIAYMNINFQTGILVEQYNKMIKGPSYAGLIRKRRYIQNNLKQYRPSPKVAKSRGQDDKKYRDRYGPVYE